MIPKTPRQRNPLLLEIAQGRPCLIGLSGCDGGGDTTVAAHSDWADLGGKGMARKADDFMTVWACCSCHYEIGHGKKLSNEEKRQAWSEAHKRQIAEWNNIVRNMMERPRTRASAAWAISMLETTKDTCESEKKSSTAEDAGNGTVKAGWHR